MQDDSVSPKMLIAWTQEASEYMEETGFSRFPTELQDELFSRGARRCSRCRMVQALWEFPRNRSGRKGIHHSCKACMRQACASSHQTHRDARLEYKRTFYTENRERLLEHSRDYHLRHPWVRALSEGYLKADRAGLPANRITEGELLAYWRSKGIDPRRCVYTGVELVPFLNRSLDHKTPLSEPDSPGHVLENLVPADNAVNTSKRNRGSVEYVITRTDYKETISA